MKSNPDSSEDGDRGAFAPDREFKPPEEKKGEKSPQKFGIGQYFKTSEEIKEIVQHMSSQR